MEMNERKNKLSNNQEEDIWKVNKPNNKQLLEPINEKYENKINLSQFENKNKNINKNIIPKLNTKD